MTDDGTKGAERTREALIDAGTDLFGRLGFAGASTREIAGRAGVNIAAIAYHFGGKEGLRLACIEAIDARLGAIVERAGPMPVTPHAAKLRLEAIVRAAVTFMAVEARAQAIAAFLLREITTETGPLIDTVFQRIVEPRHRAVCQLWGLATGTDPESEETRLSVFAIIGQVIYFRIGQPMVLRRMGWDVIDVNAAGRIADLLVRNLRAALAATERDLP